MKKWPYIPIRPENGGKIVSRSCKMNKHETCRQSLMAKNKWLICPNNTPRMVA